MTTTGQPRPSRRRRVLVVVGLVTTAVIAVVLMWSLQRSMIYFPDTSAVPAAAEVLEGGRDLTLHTANGLQLSAWFAPPAGEAEARELAILMAPGNAGNRANRLRLAQAFQARGFAVLVMDYRGYSTNPGSPNQHGLIADGRAAVQALEDLGYPPKSTLYFGESLGGGVIAALLAEHPPAAAIFRSPFTELADVAAHHYPGLSVRLILRDRFPVVDHVAHTDVPIAVIRAEHDTVIPTHLSAHVADAAPHLLFDHVMDGANHNDPIMFGPHIADFVAEVADTLND
ncbi:alpha/beta hydrolase [Enteractinococcus helveticum]|uniref:AB hydrolase-1 domain-containing protein n=1 Tax=Enteractinococcus helveticum TaxID=1837282 RepID=A0A1B7LV71_9MICC|nr:alpha/beta hydrolase [Enteractinococcus helveticum]OAV52022.1 hypothetical protein A6F49_01285 [Enteractinococcus helveticum]